MSKRDKGRLEPFVPLLISTLDSQAWKELSHGAKALYVSLRRRVVRGRNRAYLSYRDARLEIKSSQRKIGEWFKELEHYGFIVLARHGSLGVDGVGKAPHWRLTELGQTSKLSASDGFEPATRDFLRWDGTPFKRSKKQKPASYGGYTPLPTSEAPPLPTGVTPELRSASYGVCIGADESASYGVDITSLTTSGGFGVPTPSSAEPLEQASNNFGPMEDPLVAALGNWGNAAQRKRFERVKARFDALPDPRLEVAA